MIHTTGHVVAHFVTQLPQSHGVEWSSWVSAAAAVVQALGALAAIWYSGKLARDAAQREKDADAAAEKRIQKADAAAADRRLADQEAILARDHDRAVEEHNQPIRLALDLGDRAIGEIAAAAAEYRERVERKETNMTWAPISPVQLVAYEQLPRLRERASTAASALAIERVRSTITPFSETLYVPAFEWVKYLTTRMKNLSEALERLKEELR